VAGGGVDSCAIPRTPSIYFQVKRDYHKTEIERDFQSNELKSDRLKAVVSWGGKQ